MNETNLIQLMTIVEHTVRPVRASTSRKRKMREELLAHVRGVFEEESVKLSDDRAALERTALRFGDPVEVTSQLQESVSASDGISRFFDLDGLPGESTLRHALPLARLTGAVGQIIGIIGIALFAAGSWSLSLNDALIFGVGFTVVSPLYAFGLGLLTNWVEKVLQLRMTETEPAKYQASASGILAEIAEALNGPSGRSWLPVALTADVCCFIVLCMMFAIWPLEDLDHLAAVLFLFAGYFTATSVVLAWCFANSAAVRQRYHEAWGRLHIEPPLSSQ